MCVKCVLKVVEQFFSVIKVDFCLRSKCEGTL